MKITMAVMTSAVTLALVASLSGCGGQSEVEVLESANGFVATVPTVEPTEPDTAAEDAATAKANADAQAKAQATADAKAKAAAQAKAKAAAQAKADAAAATKKAAAAAKTKAAAKAKADAAAATKKKAAASAKTKAAAKAKAAAKPKPLANVYFANCDAVRAAGADPIYAGQPGYSRKLDRDGDGVGCEG